MFVRPARAPLPEVVSRGWARSGIAFALTLGAIVAAFMLLASGTQGVATTGASGSFRVVVSSVTLPKSGDYARLAVVGGHLLVLGQGSLFPSGIAVASNGRLTPLNSRPSATCATAVVDTATLRLSDLNAANCGDPAVYHERAIAVSYWVNSRGISWIETRIARVDPSAPDGYTLGPVVMSYPQCSDCWAQQIYGDGSLWIYDGFVDAHQQGELVRVSESTGSVVQRWPLPSFARPLVAVDADGFWLAPSNESGYPAGVTPAQRILYQSLYRVSPGARAAARVFTIGTYGALWLVASVHTVWLDGGDLIGPTVLWRLEGTDAKPTLHGTYPAKSSQGAEYGEGAPTYAGNAAIGIYHVTTNFASTTATQRIVRLAPDAPSEQTVAVITAPSTITPNSFGFSSPAAVALGNSLLFLDPPNISYPAGNKPPIVQGAGVLYRVTPKPAS